MNRKISFGAAVTLAIMFSTVTFVITMIFSLRNFDGRVLSIKERETMYAKLAEIDRLVRQNYYGQLDEDALNDAIAAGYIKGTGDKYGLYLTAEQYADLLDNYAGRMVDIGITCTQDTSGYIRVVEVYEESPAHTAGILAEDLIVKVDELDVTTENYEQAVDALKGEPGTIVHVTVRRGGVETALDITRRKVEVPLVSFRVIENIGYIKIKEFTDSTPDQFDRALDALVAESQVSALIFDVRDNPGGTVTSVTQILDRLLPEGEIVSATYKNGSTEVLAYSDANAISLPMIVLINKNSASAAELFTQALKDYDKAKTVGTQSYGKGSMQTIYKLSDGSALDVTVALYNPPKSPNFEGVGIKPDYEVKLAAAQEKDRSSLDETNDPQLRKALELAGATLKNIENAIQEAQTPEESQAPQESGAVPEEPDAVVSSADS
jgi:carboxyl-terminal processing protease